MTQTDITMIIDMAVDCWHQVADDHGTRHCNCFLEKFAQRLIDEGLFVGYDKLDKLGESQ